MSERGPADARVGAVRAHAAGGPEVLCFEELALARPGAGEVLVRHEAIGLNYIDVYLRSGLYPPPAHPFVPGFEAAGVVLELGPGMRALRVGDRVAYASRPLGAYAQARVLPADRLLRLPDAVSTETAAGATLKGLTAWYLLRKTYPVTRETTLLVHAAAGGVGSLLCQWARQIGARAIGTVGSEEKAERARADGCAETIVYSREDFVARVRELTGGRGVDVVYDSVGAATFMRSLDCLRPRGLMVSFGQSSGPIAPLALSELASRGSLFLTRPSLFDYTATRAELEEGGRELYGLLERGLLRCHVARRFPLREAAAAHAELEQRRTSGSTVLVP